MPVPVCAQEPPEPEPPGGGGGKDEEVCPDNLVNIVNWFPVTPPLGNGAWFPLPPSGHRCPFYEFGWQHFLVATQPTGPMGAANFLTWAAIENTFGAGAGQPHPPGPPILAAGVIEAGQRDILVDQFRNPIFYSVQFNKTFVDFVNRYQLTTVDGIKKAPPELQLPTDVVTLKSAWQIVQQGQTPGAPLNNRMIRAQVRVPTLRLANGEVVEDRENLRTVTAQLISLHVAFTIPGHPEQDLINVRAGRRQRQLAGGTQRGGAPAAAVDDALRPESRPDRSGHAELRPLPADGTHHRTGGPGRAPDHERRQRLQRDDPAVRPADQRPPGLPRVALARDPYNLTIHDRVKVSFDTLA